jgi:hypothetical protein
MYACMINKHIKGVSLCLSSSSRCGSLRPIRFQLKLNDGTHHMGKANSKA